MADLIVSFEDEVVEFKTAESGFSFKEIGQYFSALSNEVNFRGKINVEEFEDRLVFINEGSFIPETIEAALTNGYKAPYYRNAFLGEVMVNRKVLNDNYSQLLHSNAFLDLMTVFQLDRIQKNCRYQSRNIRN